MYSAYRKFNCVLFVAAHEIAKSMTYKSKWKVTYSTIELTKSEKYYTVKQLNQETKSLTGPLTFNAPVIKAIKSKERTGNQIGISSHQLTISLKTSISTTKDKAKGVWFKCSFFSSVN